MFQLVNGIREEYGLPAFKQLDTLTAVAQLRASELPYRFDATHSRPDGSGCETAFFELGLTSFYGIGENIASGQRTAQRVVEGWMNSPGHRANILDSSFEYMGVGVCYQDGVYYWSQDFYTPW